MLTPEQTNTIHHLHWAEHWSVREIARHVHLARRTISQYLAVPAHRCSVEGFQVFGEARNTLGVPAGALI